MDHKEVFPNPLVKQVIFQIRFPNLFYLADLIGEFQVKIMKEFPDSEMLIRRQIVITDEPDKKKREQMIESPGSNAGTTIWRFSSDRGIQLELTSNSLSLVSNCHKSYNQGAQPFRSIIEFTLKHFVESTNIPIIKRIGLRYIDEGPVSENKSDVFRKYYKTSFPLDRFPIENASEMTYVVVTERGPHRLKFIEALQGAGTDRKVILDFDAWTENADPANVLKITDELHEILWKEFTACIGEPVLEYMRQIPEEKHGD
jgi:uncharacterized protein (TIGR04255 family)